jgi:hypothetical protein
MRPFLSMRCSNVDRNKSTIPKAPIHPRAGQSGTKVAKTARPSFSKVSAGLARERCQNPKGNPKLGLYGITWEIMDVNGF